MVSQSALITLGQRTILLLLLEIYHAITLTRFAYFFISTSSPSAQARATV
jgi:hypothetical protein